MSSDSSSCAVRGKIARRNAKANREQKTVGNDQDLAKELESHRGYLTRFAFFLLRDTALAEDAVQDTFIAALAHHDDFEGRSQLRAWLSGILKHKVVDLVRSRRRGPPIVSTTVSDEDDPGDSGFSESGQWVDAPAVWGLPDDALESNQFWQTYLKCCQFIPERHALVFSMREVMDLSTEEICQNLDLTVSNAHVIFFRARLRLRACMTKHWFGGQHG